MANYDELITSLQTHGQDHVLQFWDRLNDQERAELANDLASVNFDQVKSEFDTAMSAASMGKLDDFMQPPPAESIGHADSFPPSDQMREWFQAGLAAIAKGTVAALLLAGGQGTRLGSKDPKGMFPLGLPSGKTLYQLQAERLVRLQALAAAQFGGQPVIPWYIMTSDATLEKTRSYFESHHYFGLDKANIFFFKQNVIPSLTPEGKLMLGTKNSLARNPDGNGGLYRALKDFGALADMAARKIEHVHVYCVDNVLVKVANPVFIGFCMSINAPAGALVVPKASPEEKVGVVCQVNGKHQVVEYSEISEKTAHLRNADGALTYAAGNICNHYFTRDFLEICSKRYDELPYHVAHKKIPVANEEGVPETPTSNNGIKLEKFVFDVFRFADKLAILEVTREAAFSPLKNASGAESGTAETCCRDLFNLHRRYLAAAGAKFVVGGQEVCSD
ncbi:uncharacterized protein MONBRDRAFT_37533 [Monosiga brevicollis MX1]|uniref:UDP-N-acetylglucosamine diphosphorylase n=1 Tax=Monosiga brevicollis TaxID=81824 RepID=A9V2B5_MONBE|nr:uncharacterized protein MONBRDRAFT_37533 [Monosiga brevicollis MX1]EDQ88346.1 predicted protein [Monosiga brevicollis MX1]|eukprot:XP_001746939.1 hypothetical protein [Monosiga brevicollis MX1]